MKFVALFYEFFRFTNPKPYPTHRANNAATRLITTRTLILVMSVASCNLPPLNTDSQYSLTPTEVTLP